MLNKDLLEILRCPKCRGVLTEQSTAEGEGLHCAACQLCYPILDGIPNLLIEEARPLAEAAGP